MLKDIFIALFNHYVQLFLSYSLDNCKTIIQYRREKFLIDFTPLVLSFYTTYFYLIYSSLSYIAYNSDSTLNKDGHQIRFFSVYCLQNRTQVHRKYNSHNIGGLLKWVYYELLAHQIYTHEGIISRVQTFLSHEKTCTPETDLSLWNYFT